MKKSKEQSHLHILWTSDNPITAEKMVFMYAINSIVKGWWDKVTLIVWGASALLVSEDENIQQRIQDAIDVGIHVSACKACADQLGVSQTLESLNIELKYWGQPLTEILKNHDRLLTV
jgi:hypothetical protein